MEAGKLRHRVTIQDSVGNADGYGERIQTWSDTATIWGSIEPLSGEELVLAQQVAAETTHRVRMRYRTLAPTSRLAFGARTFAVTSIMNPEERGAELVLLCKEVT